MSNTDETISIRPPLPVCCTCWPQAGSRARAITAPDLLPMRTRRVRQHTGKHINARCRNRGPARLRGLLDRCRSGDRAII